MQRNGGHEETGTTGRFPFFLTMRHPESLIISTAEFALAGIAALVLVGSAPAPSHKTPGPQLSCPACGTYLRGRNAPGNNWPVRHLPTPRRYAPDRPLDHRAW